MTYKVVCPVSNNQVVVNLPPDFNDRKEVTVFVDDNIDNKAHKLELLRMASNDPLFLADIREVHEDFDSIEDETL